jgi:beta-galactosidase
MKNITNFCILLTMFWGGMTALAQERTPLIQFGLMTDIQYCDCDTWGSRFFRNSLKKLEEAVNFFNAQNVQFTINLGDNIDSNSENYSADFNAVLYRLGHLKNHVYNTPGNHCYRGITENRILYEKLNMPSTYYFFQKGNWMFIMLNTNEVSTYANIAGTPLEQELSVILDRIKSSGGRQGASWNGGVSQKQLKWLKNLLEKAEKSEYNVLVFSHHPLYPESAFNALNSIDILNIVSKFSNVRAIFSGHHHAGSFAYFENIPVITVEGMVETEKENAFGIVTICDDKIVLEGEGRMTSRVVYLRTCLT